MMMIFTKPIAIERNREREARVRLTDELLELLETAKKENVRWEGSMADLMEVAHIAYKMGRLCNDDGSMCQFGYIVSHTCLLLNVKAPAHPRQAAFHSEHRKGIKQDCFLKRYCRMMDSSEGNGNKGSLLRMYVRNCDN